MGLVRARRSEGMLMVKSAVLVCLASFGLRRTPDDQPYHVLRFDVDGKVALLFSCTKDYLEDVKVTYRPIWRFTRNYMETDGRFGMTEPLRVYWRT
jgi:hypothetical protein